MGSKIFRKKGIIIVCLIVCVFIAITFFNRNKTEGEMISFNYSKVSSAINFSEKSVLYFDDDSVLHCIDKETGKDIVYCDKPNCSHKKWSQNNLSPDCPAVFWGLNKTGAVLFKNNLYFIGNMSEEDTINTQYLYKMDPNGANRRTVATLAGIQGPGEILYRDHYVIGSYVNSCETDENGNIINDDVTQAGIFVVDLDDNKVYRSKLIDAMCASIEDIYYSDGKVYYTASHFDEDMTPDQFEDIFDENFQQYTFDNILNDVFVFDIASGETDKIKTYQKLNNFDLLEKYVFYSDESGLHRFDIESGEEVIIDEATNIEGIQGSCDDYYGIAWDNNSHTGDILHFKNNKKSFIKNVDDCFIRCVCQNSIYVDYYDDEERLCLGVVSKEEFDRGDFNIKFLRSYNSEIE